MKLSILENHLQQFRNPEQFHQIHAQMTITGYMRDTFAASRLLLFSAKSAFMDLSNQLLLLRQIERPNAFIVNTVMKASVQRNHPRRSFVLYKSMLEIDLVPDNYTHPILIQASALLSLASEGKQIHAHVSKFGFCSNVYSTNNLISMYSACGSIDDARQAFDTCRTLDYVSWNSILAAYVQAGYTEEACKIFETMPAQSTIAANSMIRLFDRSYKVDDARKLFNRMRERDAITWTAMISCYEHNGMFQEAVELFYRMNNQGILADDVVLISVLSACAHLVSSIQGERIHSLISKTGLEDYINLKNSLIYMYSGFGNVVAVRKIFDSGACFDQITSNSMISCYLKCEMVDEALLFFNGMPEKDVFSWTTMIAGCVKCDRFLEALELFNKMQGIDIRPDDATLPSVISACARLSGLEQGKWVHAYINKNNHVMNVFLGTALVDMYMKCGCTDTALEVFNGMQAKSVSTWNAVISGLAMNGLIDESLEMFAKMEKCGVFPNEITFVAVLGACRHACLVDEGRRLFRSMLEVHQILPNLKHYGCMVDLLGRAGFLREAVELLASMPMDPDVVTLGALLGACKKHNDTEMGERLGRLLIEIDPKHDGFHVLLSNIYASKGMWDDLMNLRWEMRQQGVVKLPGCSMIEFYGTVYEFFAGERAHTQVKKIDDMLDEIAKRLKIEGYDPKTSTVSFDIAEEEKETILYRHSEKLAIAFGLINVCPPAPIRIINNLRICSDCHAFAKVVSSSFQRELVVRDRHRFHHFKEGVCSCRDFW